MKSQYHVVFFDVDSTLVTIEGIDVLADGNPEVVELTEAAMNGDIPINEVYGRRLDIIRPSEADLAKLGERYVSSMVPGVREVFRQLHDAGCDIHLVTAGIQQAIVPLANELGISPRATHSVALTFDGEGKYGDFDRRSPLTRPGGKELVVLNVRARSHGKAVFVGDGVTDLDAKPAVNLFIGFGGVQVRDRVRDAADVYVTDPDLTAILPYILSEES